MKDLPLDTAAQQNPLHSKLFPHRNPKISDRRSELDMDHLHPSSDHSSLHASALNFGVNIIKSGEQQLVKLQERGFTGNCAQCAMIQLMIH